ncbi:tyrosine-type recombinase/integrase [Desulfovibrio sp. OttesenSCG-928-G11]|nr:tyrosine-type recombinase/integrase [Desulfovibrio sp. OttesenSCG-928-G11]
MQRKISFKLTPHMLRHTFATELVRKDINLFKISRILGHSNTKTTQIYLGLDTRDLRNDLNTKSLFIC